VSTDTTHLRAQVLEAIGEIAPEADLAALPDDAPLREELELDSLDVQNLVIAIHARLGIDVPERDYGKLDTLAGAVAYLASRAGSAP
jgi:acyl carrier protein